MAKTQIAVFSTKPYDEAYLSKANEAHGHELNFSKAFFTHNAMTQIAATTLANVTAFAAGKQSGEEVHPTRK